MGWGERADVLQGTQWSGALDKGSNSMYDRSVHGFAVFKKEMPDSARAEAAFMHLQQHGLGVFVTNIQVYTTNNKASTLWSDNFLTKVAGSLGHIFLKIPFDYYPVSDLAGRFTAAQIPLNTVVADPRVPINLEGANRNTGGKMASYLRWLLTALGYGACGAAFRIL